MVGLPLNCERVIVLPNWSVSLKSGAIVLPRSVPWRPDWLVLVVCAALLGVAVCLPVRLPRRAVMITTSIASARTESRDARRQFIFDFLSSKSHNRVPTWVNGLLNR